MKSRLAISGLGGSGTRVFAEIIQQFGYHIGDDLNHASDNLWWTLLFKRLSVLVDQDEQLELLYDAFANRMGNCPQVDDQLISQRIRSLANEPRTQHPPHWLQQRTDSFLAPMRPSQTVRSHWAWKEPNTHLLAEFLLRYDPKLTIIHVVRDPIYMSFSSNQNQLLFWGPTLFNSDIAASPATSLTYWCRTHSRLEALAQQFPKRLIFVSHEYACINPTGAVDELASFVGVDLTSRLSDKAATFVSGDRLAIATDKQRGYPFSTSDLHWAADFMQRNFGSSISRLYRPHS